MKIRTCYETQEIFLKNCPTWRDKLQSMTMNKTRVDFTIILFLRIHAFGNKFLVQNHPDGRAIMYESATYSKRKILDLISTLQAFENGQSITAIFECKFQFTKQDLFFNFLFAACENKLLKKLTQYGNNYMFLDLTKTLRYFKVSHYRT